MVETEQDFAELFKGSFNPTLDDIAEKDGLTGDDLTREGLSPEGSSEEPSEEPEKFLSDKEFTFNNERERPWKPVDHFNKPRRFAEPPRHVLAANQRDKE